MILKPKQPGRGFTLIELLVVISIISLLASVVLASLNSARDKGRLAAAKEFDAEMYHAEADQAAGIWDFDECSGTSGSDRSGNANAASLAGGSSWSTNTPFASGCSLSLDGSTGYATVGSASSYSFVEDTGVFSISAWVKTTNPAAAQSIMSNTVTRTEKGFYITVGSNQISARIMGGGVYIFNTSTASVLFDTNWHHVAVASDGTTLKIYFDGSLAASAAAINAPTSGDATRAATIGSDALGGSFWNGQIDAVRIYSKALTASNVKDIFASERGSHLADK